MYKINQVKIKIDKELDEYPRMLARRLNIRMNEIKDVKLVKRSIDARKKDDVHYSCSFIFNIDMSEEDFYKKVSRKLITEVKETEEIKYYKTNKKIIIVGTGPAGLFSALTLLKGGNEVVLIERGESVKERKKTVEDFFNNGALNPNSNIQFGEGGAGTFSDGKLTTNLSNPLIEEVIKTFVEMGANEDLLYDAKPHIGTDYLVKVVENIRNEIIDLGGTFLFNTTLVDLIIDDANEIKKIKVKTKDNTIEQLYLDALVLAIGHSARDTYEMLYKHEIKMSQKTFAVGFRIEHPQSMINEKQYGKKFMEQLEAADYKLAYHDENNRGVYTFCMCPGGYVVASSSEMGGVVTNGMSEHARDGMNANSAVVVNVFPSDFKSDHPLEGIRFQQKLEKKAFELGGGGYAAPISLMKDYLSRTVSTDLGKIDPTYRPNVKFADLNKILPHYLNKALKRGLKSFNNKIKGFIMDDAILTAVESRSSAPVRIDRDENYGTNIKGIYPIGEGAGYAGGITSSSLDGIKFAISFMERNK